MLNSSLQLLGCIMPIKCETMQLTHTTSLSNLLWTTNTNVCTQTDTCSHLCSLCSGCSSINWECCFYASSIIPRNHTMWGLRIAKQSALWPFTGKTLVSRAGSYWSIDAFTVYCNSSASPARLQIVCRLMLSATLLCNAMKGGNINLQVFQLQAKHANHWAMIMWRSCLHSSGMTTTPGQNPDSGGPWLHIAAMMRIITVLIVSITEAQNYVRIFSSQSYSTNTAHFSTDYQRVSEFEWVEA